MSLLKRLKRRLFSKKKRVSRKIKSVAGSLHRAVVHKSNKTLYLQLLEPETGNSLIYLSSKQFGGKNKSVAEKMGESFGKLCLEKKVEKVVFDRNGFLYHGKVAALADGMRKSGTVF